MNQTIQILLNGETHSFDFPLSLDELLNNFKIKSPHLAIVRNGEVVPRPLIAQTELKEGDVIEVVRAVAGG